jgi:hypothetical protein
MALPLPPEGSALPSEMIGEQVLAGGITRPQISRPSLDPLTLDYANRAAQRPAQSIRRVVLDPRLAPAPI